MSAPPVPRLRACLAGAMGSRQLGPCIGTAPVLPPAWLGGPAVVWTARSFTTAMASCPAPARRSEASRAMSQDALWSFISHYQSQVCCMGMIGLPE